MKESFAETIAAALPGRFLLITCGLPATGKTTAGRAVAKITGSRLLRTDDIRRELLEGEDIFDERVAADMDKRLRVYREMFRRAADALDGGKSIILDATFITRALRREAAGIAAGHRAGFAIVETVCPQEIAVHRLEGRTRENYESNALSEEAYHANRERFEPVDIAGLRREFPGLTARHFTVDTASEDPVHWQVENRD